MRPTAAFPHPALSSGALQFPERGAKGAVRLTASQSASPPRDSCPLETTNRAPFTGGMPIRDALPNDAPKQGTTDVGIWMIWHMLWSSQMTPAFSGAVKACFCVDLSSLDVPTPDGTGGDCRALKRNNKPSPSLKNSAVGWWRAIGLRASPVLAVSTFSRKKPGVH